MVVVVGPVELHGNGASGNADGCQHRAQKDDVIVAVTVGETLLADGVEEDQRSLNELPAIRIGEVDHLPHHERCDGGRMALDVVVDAGSEERESRCPDAGISAKLFDHELNGTDDRPRIRGFGVQRNPMNGSIWSEQVLAKRNSRCCLVVDTATRGSRRFVVDHLHHGCVPAGDCVARQESSC